jgi:hypothetical protein
MADQERDEKRKLEQQRLADAILDLTDEGSLAHELRQQGEYIEPSGEYHDGPFNLQDLEDIPSGYRHPRTLPDSDEEFYFGDIEPPLPPAPYPNPVSAHELANLYRDTKAQREEAERELSNFSQEQYWPSRDDLRHQLDLVDEGIRALEYEDEENLDETLEELKEVNKKYQAKKGKGKKRKQIKRRIRRK